MPRFSIINNEHDDYDMRPDDFISFVKNELNRYIPRIRKYAATHSRTECIAQAGRWWERCCISETTERALQRYIISSLFSR